MQSRHGWVLPPKPCEKNVQKTLKILARQSSSIVHLNVTRNFLCRQQASSGGAWAGVQSISRDHGRTFKEKNEYEARSSLFSFFCLLAAF